MNNETLKQVVDISGEQIDELVDELVKNPELLAFIGTTWMDAVNNSTAVNTIIDKTLADWKPKEDAEEMLARFAAKMLFFGYHAGLKAEQERLKTC